MIDITFRNLTPDEAAALIAALKKHRKKNPVAQADPPDPDGPGGDPGPGQ